MFLWLLVFGFMPVIFGGFATNQSVQEIGQLGALIRLTQMENTIKAYKIDFCTAQYMGDQRIMDIMGEVLRQQRTEYYNFTARWAPPARYWGQEPTCETLIATKAVH